MHDAFPVVEIGVGPAVAQIDSNLVKNMTAAVCVRGTTLRAKNCTMAQCSSGMQYTLGHFVFR